MQNIRLPCLAGQKQILEIGRLLMAEGSRQLLRVLDEIQQGIQERDVAARRGEGVGLGFVDEVELEGMRIARLSNPRNRIR
jgi:hypothetical protein